MATKAKAVKLLSKHEPEATLIDESSAGHYTVQLEAPHGHHWDGDVHCRCVHWFDGGNKSEFWDEVCEVIHDLTEARVCNDGDCEGIQMWGECEYWIND